MKIKIDRASEILTNVKGCRILVIGDFMLDRYVWGDCERISPEAPVPVIQVTGESTRLGGAANVACNIKAIGGIPLLLGIIGKDNPAQEFRDILKEDGISQDYLVSTSERPTTIKTRVIAQNQQVVRVDRENSKDISGDLLASTKKMIAKSMEDCDGILVSDYGKGLITEELLEFILGLA